MKICISEKQLTKPQISIPVESTYFSVKCKIKPTNLNVGSKNHRKQQQQKIKSNADS
jgi:hypothetical protein